MDGFNAHILSDEASAGSVVVGTGISATLLLFFQQSFERMLPYLVIEAVVEAKTGANIEGAITIKKRRNPKTKRRSRMVRKINYIIVHCTATPEGRWVTNEEITRWHKARGFRTIGYHYVVYLDGTVHAGRPENEVGAHCLGRNEDSIGVCYVGGLDKSGKAKDTRTLAQREALTKLLKDLKARYLNAEIRGHRDFARKACPCFDATSEYKAL